MLPNYAQPTFERFLLGDKEREKTVKRIKKNLSSEKPTLYIDNLFDLPLAYDLAINGFDVSCVQFERKSYRDFPETMKKKNYLKGRITVISSERFYLSNRKYEQALLCLPSLQDLDKILSTLGQRLQDRKLLLISPEKESNIKNSSAIKKIKTCYETSLYNIYSLSLSL